MKEEKHQEYIEGFKGIHMSCLNDIKEHNHEINCDMQTYVDKWYNSIPFSLTLEREIYQMNNDYSFDNTLSFNFEIRYFKVNALKSDIFSFSDQESYFSDKIIIKEELGYSDLKEYIDKRFPLVENYDDYTKCCKLGCDIFSKYKFIEKMMGYGFSESFSIIISDSVNSIKQMTDILNYTKALHEENINTDMKVYLLLKVIKIV